MDLAFCATLSFMIMAQCAHRTMQYALCFYNLFPWGVFFILHWMFKNEGLRHLGWVACKWQACFLLQRLVLDFFWGGNMGTIMKIDDVYDSAFYVTSLIYTQLIINKCKSIKGSMVVPWCTMVSVCSRINILYKRSRNSMWACIHRGVIVFA